MILSLIQTNFQSLNSIEPISNNCLKPDSLPTSPIASRDKSKEAILHLPLIPIVKIKTEVHPRSKLSDGESSFPLILH